MDHVEGSIVIRAPIERVYAYLTDISRVAEWCSAVLDARWIDQTPKIAGSKAEMVVKIAGQSIPSSVMVLKADAPHYFSVRALTGVMGTYTWKLESTPEGTRLTRTIDWAVPRTSILGRELDVLVAERAQARTIDQDLNNIKAVLEPASGG